MNGLESPGFSRGEDVKGLGYLTSGATERGRWKRLALMVDTSDTLTGVVHLVRRDVSLRAMLSMVGLTGGYAVIGAAKVASELGAAGASNAVSRVGVS